MIASPEPDFAAARALNREGLMRFSQERSIIATLNDRLAVLIDMVRLGEAALCDRVQNNWAHVKCFTHSTTSLVFYLTQKAYYAFVKVISSL